MNLIKSMLMQKIQGRRQESKFSDNSFIGFNQRKKIKVRKIPYLNSNHINLTQLNNLQKKIQNDITQLNEMLKCRNKNLTYKKGYLFTRDINSTLIEQFQNTIYSNLDYINDGFVYWRFEESPRGVEIYNSRIMESPKKFNNNSLMEKSIQNIERYNSRLYQQSVKFVNKEWKYFSKSKDDNHRIQRTKTQGYQQTIANRYHDKTEMRKSPEILHKKLTMKNISNQQSTSLSPLKFPQIKRQNNQKMYISSKIKNHNAIQKQEIRQIINNQTSIVSIWTPPSTHPQFYGLISFQIQSFSIQYNVFWIKKYFLPRHGLHPKFFNSLLQWSSQQFGKISELGMMTSKSQYNSIFMKHGWRLISWVSQEKVKIAYKNMFL